MKEEVHKGVTLAFLTYNQEPFVRAAVRSALAQEYDELEVICSDDCSEDRSFAIVEEEVRAYRGPHSIVLNRNGTNQGLARHLCAIAARAKYEFIVIAAGDDISLPGRVRSLWEQYSVASTEHFYVSSNAFMIDDRGKRTEERMLQGHWPNDEMRLARGIAMPLGATEAFTRGLITQFGGLPPEVMNEDFVLPFRAHLIGKVAYVDQALIEYRVCDGSISHQGCGNTTQGVYGGRARYFARQQAAVHCMLKDLSIAESRVDIQLEEARGRRLRHALRRRLRSLFALEAYCRLRPEGRSTRAAIELLRVPSEMAVMVNRRVVAKIRELL